MSAPHGKSKSLLHTAEIGALGVVFGDIGTSPLYAFRVSLATASGGTFALSDVLGVLSMIFWALTLSVSIKYVCFVLRASNEGEGGVLALITRLRLHKEKTTINKILLIVGLMGAGMLFADGVLTPAISVLSAVEGLQVVAPALEHWTVTLAMLIIMGVFISQRFGTEKIGVMYGPLLFLWFIILAVLGVSQIVQNPVVLQAVNPQHAIKLFDAHPGISLAIVGAAFLAVTGGEALYADLGLFGHKGIARAWLFIAMPGLVLNYFGQGALVLGAEGKVSNPFFEMAPEWFGIPLLVIATCAALIAAQAVITSAFSLAKQTVEIGYLPPMRMRNTSEHNQQHIYIPRVNTIMMVVTLTIVAAFKTSGNLASAYGIAVACSMVTTTILFTVMMFRIWKWPVWIGAPLAGLFLILDMSFVAGNVAKLTHGGWLPVGIAIFIIILMLSWNRGVTSVITRHMGYTEPLADYAGRVARAPLAQSSKTAVFFSRTGVMAPVPLERITDLMRLRFERTVIVSIQISARPRVAFEDRVKVVEIDERVLKIETRFGYLQTINIPATIAPTLRQNGMDPEEAIYVIGHERIVPPEEVRGPGDIWDFLFSFMAMSAERSVDRFHLPRRRTLEIGYSVHL